MDSIDIKYNLMAINSKIANFSANSLSHLQAALTMLFNQAEITSTHGTVDNYKTRSCALFKRMTRVGFLTRLTEILRR